MKTCGMKALVVGVCAAALIAAACSLAADTAKSTTQMAAPAKEEPKKVELTGSRIPRVVKKAGRITDGAQPVTVIDQKQIQRSGAQDLAGVLRTDPSIVVKRGP